MNTDHQLILILDFGSQYTQLIARRIRQLGVYCEIAPFWTHPVKSRTLSGVIFSGGPSSVYSTNAPHADRAWLESGVPILGICYGLQHLAWFLGGQVQPASHHEYGHALLERIGPSKLLDGLPPSLDVWMSHGDWVSTPPAGFVVTARTENALAAVEDPSRSLYGLQFHPEVAHTPLGSAILENFVLRICKCRGDWTMSAFLESAVADIRNKVGPKDQVVSGLSGGVDSTVAATLVHHAIGQRQTCLFVDNGLLRLGEAKEVLSSFTDSLHLNVVPLNAQDRFYAALSGVIDPEQKRKVIGREFVHLFQEHAALIPDVSFLVQGTLYPDVIESVSVKGPSAVIKSHHNVGGLPDSLHLALIEPLRELFKDEVRQLGRALSIPEPLLERHPFPGPGLAVRILGEVTPQRVLLLQNADAICEQEIRASGLYNQLWQAFAILLPVSTVGVMGDQRTYESTIAIRAVESQDGMTADWARLPYDLLQRISSRIISEVRGINRVVYDISSKPPATIEWE